MGDSQRGHGADFFVPFNDAQWTIPNARYGIAYENAGQLLYEDHTSARVATGTSRWGIVTELVRADGICIEPRRERDAGAQGESTASAGDAREECRDEDEPESPAR